MDYLLAISPDPQIDAEEFASVWNQNPKSSNIAQAHVATAAKESYPFITPEMFNQGLVLLTGAVGAIALDVIKDVVKDQIKKVLAARSGSSDAPPFEVIVVQPSDKPVIIVKAKA